MPDFARVTAYIIIDTMTLLLWHQTIMSRVSRGSCHAHLKSLVDFYLRQCQPLPLTFALGRPHGDKEGQAILFVSPIKGNEQEAAARKAEFVPRPDVVAVQVQGPNRTGGNFKLTAALAHADLSVRALVTSTIEDQFTAVFALSSDKDADKAIKVLKKVVEAK